MRLNVRRSNDSTKGRLIEAIRTYLPGAWVTPSKNDLVSLYSLRYRMALDEQKYDTAMIFLNKIIEVDPGNVEAKLCKAEIYHRHLGDLTHAVEQYNKVLRQTSGSKTDATHDRAKKSLTEIMELLS
jgi:tetratricopeptide (TPR) repeat protein